MTPAARTRQPTIRTRRLLLRPFTEADADGVAGLATAREVALNTFNIPHPYVREDAVIWIRSHAGQLERGEAVTYAVTLADRVIGAVGLILEPEHHRAELGYWIGTPFWGQGYATEAAAALLRWGFDTFDLHRIHASHFPRNPASGRVLQKLGMRHEGSLREHVQKWGEFLDLERYGILRSELPRP